MRRREISNIAHRVLPSRVYDWQAVKRRKKFWLEAGVLFIHIPKNAGTSVNKALYDRFMGHISVGSIEAYGGGEVLNLPKFCITRNPWERCLSSYMFAKRVRQKNADYVKISPRKVYFSEKFESFENFVESYLSVESLDTLDDVFKAQSGFIKCRSGEVPDSLKCFDIKDMNAVESYLQGVLGRQVEIGVFNSTGRKDYREHYTPKMRELVSRIYKEDIERFEYEF